MITSAKEIILGGPGKPHGKPISGTDGEFVRKSTHEFLRGSCFLIFVLKFVVTNFHDTITSDGSGEYKPESNRFHLYIQKACPWSHRSECHVLPHKQSNAHYNSAYIVWSLKGLQKHISVTNLDWLLLSDGWRFTKERPDPLYGKSKLREIYGLGTDNLVTPEQQSTYFLLPVLICHSPHTLAGEKSPYSMFTGKVTVPVLWDTVGEVIVNNESSEILRIFNHEFNEYSTNPDLDLYPEVIVLLCGNYCADGKELRDEIDEVNKWVYFGLNDGVYQAGFASTQEAYDKAANLVFETLDRMEVHLLLLLPPY